MEDEDGFFSDNYFDLLPGEEVVMLLSTEMGMQTLKRELRLRCLLR